MLHYRLFVEVNDAHAEVERRATEQVHSWVRNCRLDADALTLGREVVLGRAARGSLAAAEHDNGDRFLRAVIAQGHPNGEWTTRLTVHTPADTRHKPWLWLDLTGPDHVDGRVPGLARSLLQVFDATTGDVRQGEAQVVRGVGEVRELVEAVCAPARRTLIFVAGSDDRFPLPDWTTHVRALLRDAVGLAGGYVLTPDATAAFNNAIGPVHKVPPWTVRTFRSGVEPDNVQDGRRHKVLGLERIIDDSTRRLAAALGRRARDAALDTPLPELATRIDRDFEGLVNADLVAALTVRPAGQVPEEAALAARFAGYERRLARVEAERQELRARLEDSQLETAVAEDEHARAAAEIRRLQKLLVKTGRAAEVWTPEDTRTADRRPQDCEDLVGRFSTWRHVCHTGQVDSLLELDQFDPTGGWAAKVWDILGALDDYATAVLAGDFDGNVHSYLSHTPPGLRTFSATRHAADESATVRENPKLAAERVLPVPTAVDPDGQLFMGAHFKIAKSGIISPRLHYHNDVRGTGRVYVGYIGRHLRNTRTN